LSCTTVLGAIVLRARGKARVELGSFDIVIRVRVDAVTRLLRRALLQVPRTPSRDLILVYVLIKREWIRGVRAEKVWVFWIRIVTLRCEEAGCALTRRVGQIRRDIVKRDVLERL
jgi:hypothetical protein